MAKRYKAIKITGKTDVGSLLDTAEAEERVFLDRDGVIFWLSREEHITYELDAELVRKMLRATAGSWADLDIDQVVADLYAAREAGSRPTERS